MWRSTHTDIPQGLHVCTNGRYRGEIRQCKIVLFFGYGERFVKGDGFVAFSFVTKVYMYTPPPALLFLCLCVHLFVPNGLLCNRAIYF